MTGNAFSAREVAAALAVGTIAILMIGVQPILLGELVDAQQVTLEGVGLVAMGEIVALGIGVALGDFLMPGTWLRSATIVAGLTAAAFDLLTTRASGDSMMLAARACAGLAEGLLIWGTTGVVVRSANPGRVSGIFFVAQTIAQSLLGAALANLVIPRTGWQGGFATLAVLSLLSCGLAFLQPAALPSLASDSQSGFRWTPTTLQPLVVAFLQLACLGAFWAYLEPLGKAAGLDARAAQTLISGVLAMQVVGGSVASFCVRRLGAEQALLSVSVMFIAIMAVVHKLPAGQVAGFGAVCLVLGFVWLFALPFQIALAFRADPSGRLAGLVPAAQLLGSATGPLTASFFVQGDNVSAVPLTSAMFAVSAALLLAAMHRRGASAVA
ncbi:MFS transporter (plasmid) [Ralstonia sp. R-29]|uniref:MFS transporter n=1 Tax=Ralstonia sp. R-29 TaxID=3404059 RepID=UPI003CEE3F0D